jgi:hypothetical protein
MTPFTLKQDTQSHIRALDAAQIEAVSGAKSQTYDFGVLGTLYTDDRCAIWSMSTVDDQGFFSVQQEGYCPPK